MGCCALRAKFCVALLHTTWHRAMPANSLLCLHHRAEAILTSAFNMLSCTCRQPDWLGLWSHLPGVRWVQSERDSYSYSYKLGSPIWMSNPQGT
jgi:hypothetical protein